MLDQCRATPCRSQDGGCSPVISFKGPLLRTSTDIYVEWTLSDTVWDKDRKLYWMWNVDGHRRMSQRGVKSTVLYYREWRQHCLFKATSSQFMYMCVNVLSLILSLSLLSLSLSPPLSLSFVFVVVNNTLRWNRELLLRICCLCERGLFATTVEQIFNSRVIIEKHNFIDFRSFNTEEALAQAIQALWENWSGAVLLYSQLALI